MMGMELELATIGKAVITSRGSKSRIVSKLIKPRNIFSGEAATVCQVGLQLQLSFTPKNQGSSIYCMQSLGSRGAGELRGDQQ